MSWIAYEPLDAALEKPLVRILRALRHFESVSSRDLLNAMGLTEYGHQRHDRDWNTMTVALSRACRAGYVEATQWHREHKRYRITESGRAELKRRLTVDMECAA